MSSDEQRLAEDGRSRAQALELASFIVEAPAGAGKTELLTQRYLRLLAAVDAPEEIVAITFTNKAAAEMRNRILASLERAAAAVNDEDIPAEPHKRVTFDLARAALQAGAQRGWQLIEQPARLRILTIDALCASLARQMPFLSRFGAQPRIADDAGRHYDEAARRTLALVEREVDDDAFAAVAAAALRHFDNDAGRLRSLLARMLARRDQWLTHALGPRLRVEAEQALAALIGRDLRRIAEFFTPSLQQATLPLARFAAANLADDAPLAALRDWQAPLVGTPDELPQWRALRSLLLTGTGMFRKKLTVAEGFPPKVSDNQKQALGAVLDALRERCGAAEAFSRIAELPAAHYGEEEWQCVEIMAQLLKIAAGQLWLVFNEAGEADFVEVARRALAALGDVDAPSDLALRLDYSIRHLLVDEFQDTSPTQVQLLQRLTAGWQGDDGRTLFCVGDPMQSVYRFRKADVGLFLRAAETGIGEIPLQRLRLCRNNRSCAAVVGWVNRSFAGIFPERDSVTAGAIRYREFVAARAPLDGAGVVLDALVVDVATPGEHIDALEAARILDIVARERQADPQRRIAVLVRARSHLDALVARIRSQRPDLRFQAVEIERLAARQTVQDLLSLTRALHHRADRVHWLAILRAPWCGLRLADLHALVAHDHAATVWQLMNDEIVMARLSADGQRRLVHVRAVLAEAFAHQGRPRLRRWIEGVWLRLGAAACLRAGPGAADSADVCDARAYFDLLDALDAAGRFDLERIEVEVAALYAAPDALADGTLQFMTIHKSKGLEFDTVILPGLHRKRRNDDHALMLWEEVALDGLNERLVAAPFAGRGADGLPTPYEYLRLLERDRSANENARVLYVAATRAIRRLHLVGVARRNADGMPESPPAGSFLDLLWNSVSGEFSAAATAAAVAAPAAASAAATTEAQPAFAASLVRVCVPTPGIVAAPPSEDRAAALQIEEGGDTYDADDVDHAVADPLAASIGTLLHACLEMLAAGDLAAWDAARVDALQPALRLWLARRGHGAVAKDGAARVAAGLRATLGSSAGRWLLSSHRDGGATELALSTVVQRSGRERVARHVVDRCFIENGERWIVDYKTTQLDCAETDVVAWGRHAETHRAQLERYAGLFAEEKLPLRLAIFFAMHGRLVELPFSSPLL